MICYVCGRGFPSADEYAEHVAGHPGRSEAEMKAGQAAAARLEKKRRAEEKARAVAEAKAKAEAEETE